VDSPHGAGAVAQRALRNTALANAKQAEQSTMVSLMVKSDVFVVTTLDHHHSAHVLLDIFRYVTSLPEPTLEEAEGLAITSLPPSLSVLAAPKSWLHETTTADVLAARSVETGTSNRKTLKKISKASKVEKSETEDNQVLCLAGIPGVSVPVSIVVQEELGSLVDILDMTRKVGRKASKKTIQNILWTSKSNKKRKVGPSNAEKILSTLGIK